MRFTIGLPVGDPSWLGDAARAVEDAGFDAVWVTDHPFPTETWLLHGGHPTLDPLVALTFAAGATSTVRLHTNILVLPYRNPYLVAKGVSTLDVLSGGRVILGVGAGYLQPEFAVLGADFDSRNEAVDRGISAMRAAWTGEPVEGHVMLPTPVQRPHPPIWVGGNSRAAIRRAVDLGDGWTPFPQPAGAARFTRTAALDTIDALRARIAYARDYAAEVGRTEPLDICFVPFGMTLGREVDGARLAEGLAEMEDAGVTWVSVAPQADSLDAFRSWVERLASRSL